MSKEEVIEKTVRALHLMPAEKGVEVADFAEFMLQKAEEEQLQKGMEEMVQNADAFSFLKDEEDLYTIDDLKQKY